MDELAIESFSDHLRRLKHEIKICPLCHMLTDKDVCDICSDEHEIIQPLWWLLMLNDVFIFRENAILSRRISCAWWFN